MKITIILNAILIKLYENSFMKIAAIINYMIIKHFFITNMFFENFMSIFNNYFCEIYSLKLKIWFKYHVILGVPFV